MHRSESNRVRECAETLKTIITDAPKIAVVLGSGLGTFADTLEKSRAIAFEQIPTMPASTVPGHKGRFVFGSIHDVSVIAMQGRIHLYEGHAAEDVVLGVRAMLSLGANTLIVTNAAGGIAKHLHAGDLMLIEDHINLTGTNSLCGPEDPALGRRFVDMTQAYDTSLMELAEQSSSSLGFSFARGVYAGLLGPSYETPAEVRMLRILGADAVGMSTVLETIAARQQNARVLGISCISNLAAGLSPTPLSHDEVQATAKQVESRFVSVLQNIIQGLA